MLPFAATWWSVGLGVLTFVLWQLEIWLGAPEDGNRASQITLSVICSLAIAGVRWFPLQMSIFGAATVLAGGWFDPAGTFGVESSSFPVIVAVATFGTLYSLRERLVGLGAILAGAVAIILHLPESEIDPRASRTALLISNLIIFTVIWAIAWLIASRWRANRELRLRAAAFEAESNARAAAAVADERGRIARELHDVVAHNVSVMVVQAGGVRRLLGPDLDREREALATIEETGRRALAEMRRMVGVMRGSESTAPDLEPQPGLARLDQLVIEMREAGLPVELHVEGTPTTLSAGIDLSAYRIVQEALTNALKHAGPASAVVTVRYLAGEIELVVDDDGRGRTPSTGRTGHGLVGMRERVAVYGGRLDAGPRPGGGFRLQATLPIDASVPMSV